MLRYKHYGIGMGREDDGDYVSYDEATAIIDTYKNSVQYWKDAAEDAEQRILELEAKLKDQDKSKAEWDEAMKDVRRLRMRDMGGEE